MTWEAFEKAAPSYEDWYDSQHGRRVAAAETALLRQLLQRFPDGDRSAIEVGCGTGYFSRSIDSMQLFGMDRSRAMLTEARRLTRKVPLVQADAHHLPAFDGSVDLVLFITTLEFLTFPEQALAEAARVARAGIVILTLNRWSRGGFSRRWGRDAGGSLLKHAQDFSLPALCRLVRSSVQRPLEPLYWRSAVFPGPLHRATLPVPLGEVLGLAATFKNPPA